MNESPPTLHLVVALAAEAEPLIEQFGLAAVEAGRGLRHFRGADLSLSISGVGVIAAAATVGWLAGRYPQPTAWLNLGLAGQADGKIGELHRVHRAIGPGRQSWYPQWIGKPLAPGATVRTVDVPETQYSEPDLYDMEAAGFFGAASRHAPAEVVHGLKIISDNRQSTVKSVDRNRARQLITDQRHLIEQGVDQLRTVQIELRQRARQHPEYEAILDRWHFSMTRQRQLGGLLRRWSALGLTESPLSRLTDVETSQAVVATLQHWLDATPVKWGTR